MYRIFCVQVSATAQIAALEMWAGNAQAQLHQHDDAGSQDPPSTLKFPIGGYKGVNRG